MNNEENVGERLNFDRKCKCDFCNNIEICAITHYGTTEYNRLVCLECALDLQQREKSLFGYNVFDLNNSVIRFRDFVYNIEDEEEDEDTI